MKTLFKKIYQLRRALAILLIIFISVVFFFLFFNQSLYKTKADVKKVTVSMGSSEVGISQNKNFLIGVNLVAEDKISAGSFLLKYDSDNKDLVDISNSFTTNFLSVDSYFDEVLIQDLGRTDGAKLARVTYLKKQNESDLRNSVVIFFPFKAKQKQGETAISIIENESQVVGPIQDYLFKIQATSNLISRVNIENKFFCEDNNQCGTNSNCQNNQCQCNNGYYNCNDDWGDGCESNQVCQSNPTLNPTPIPTSTIIPTQTPTQILTPTITNLITTFIFDRNLEKEKSTTLFSTMIARDWSSPISGTRQFIHPMIQNPNNTQANITIKIYSGANSNGKSNGQLIHTIQKTIPPYGFYNSLNEIEGLPQDTDMDNQRSGVQTFGWAEITSNVPIIGHSRFRARQEQTIQTPTSTITLTQVPPTQPPTQAPTNPSGSIKLNLKLKFQGVMRQPSDINQTKMKVKIRVFGSNLSSPVLVDGNFNLTNNRNSDTDALIWEGTVDLPQSIIPGKKYNIFIKGPKHIQKKICVSNPSETSSGSYRCQAGQGITFSLGDNNLDFSKIYLLAGDIPVNGAQDGVVDSLDTSYVRNNLGKTNPTNISIADLNLDGKVDTQDWSIVLYALSVKTDEE